MKTNTIDPKERFLQIADEEIAKDGTKANNDTLDRICDRMYQEFGVEIYELDGLDDFVFGEYLEEHPYLTL